MRQWVMGHCLCDPLPVLQPICSRIDRANPQGLGYFYVRRATARQINNTDYINNINKYSK